VNFKVFIQDEKMVKMAQKNFINSWLLPCSLRSHRTAIPRPKMGFAIFRLCPPTTQTQANARKRLNAQEIFLANKSKNNNFKLN